MEVRLHSRDTSLGRSQSINIHPVDVNLRLIFQYIESIRTSSTKPPSKDTVQIFDKQLWLVRAPYVKPHGQ